MSAVCLHFSPGEVVDLQGQPQGPHLKFVDFVVERNSIEVIFLELAIHILEAILEALYLKIISIYTGCSSWKSTDLDSKIGNFDCGYSTEWKFSNLPAAMILHEINFSWFQKVKNCLCDYFEGFEFWFLKKFHIGKMSKNVKIPNSDLLKWS